MTMEVNYSTYTFIRYYVKLNYGTAYAGNHQGVREQNSVMVDAKLKNDNQSSLDSLKTILRIIILHYSLSN